MRQLLLGLIGLGSGVLTSSGVFTVVTVTGMIPRFAGRTHTARHLEIYENMVFWGTAVGNFFGLYALRIIQSDFVSQYKRFAGQFSAFLIAQNAGLILYGIFTGMFVGCLAVAIAELLDGIPIIGHGFTLLMHKGYGVFLVVMAVAKMLSAFLYFWQGGFSNQ